MVAKAPMLMAKSSEIVTNRISAAKAELQGLIRDFLAQMKERAQNRPGKE